MSDTFDEMIRSLLYMRTHEIPLSAKELRKGLFLSSQESTPASEDSPDSDVTAIAQPKMSATIP
jgi:hypothetical protein